MNLRQPWPGNLHNLGKSVKFGTQIIFEMSNKTKVLIIDDDEKSVEKLSEVLSDYPDLEVTGSAGLCSKGRELVAELKPDLLFLDIELPDCNGLDFVKEVKAANAGTYIVMFTGYYKEYEEGTFEGDEADYLLKPIDELELNKVIKRYRRYRMLSNSDLLKAPDPHPAAKGGEVFTATTYTNELRVMRLCDIGYFRYSMRRKVWEVALNDHSFVQLKRGTSANDILQYSHQFLQTHQSYIVNMHYLLLVGTTKCRLYPPFDEDELPIGRTFGRDLRRHFQEI